MVCWPSLLARTRGHHWRPRKRSPNSSPRSSPRQPLADHGCSRSTQAAGTARRPRAGKRASVASAKHDNVFRRAGIDLIMIVELAAKADNFYSLAPAQRCQVDACRNVEEDLQRARAIIDSEFV